MAVTRAGKATAGSTVKVVVRDYSTGVERAWNTAIPGFEPYLSANVASYGIAATPASSPGNFTWVTPAFPNSAMGYQYEATGYRVAGADLAESDLSNYAWEDRFAWDAISGKPTITRAIPANDVAGSGNGLWVLQAGNKIADASSTVSGNVNGHVNAVVQPVQTDVGQGGFFPPNFGNLQVASDGSYVGSSIQGFTPPQLLSLMASVLLGKSTGAGTNQERYRDMLDTKDSVVASVDSFGNRTAVTRVP